MGSTSLHFRKYQGTGNDFIMIDDRANALQLSEEQIAWLCHRRFGVGADGLILLRSLESYDFEMCYYNSDGRISSMCGNGGRCIARFARDLGMNKKEFSFIAVDGEHRARVTEAEVSLKMKSVSDIQSRGSDWWLDTGSPHHLRFCEEEELERDGVMVEARAIRYSEPYRDEGVNVNFVARSPEALRMRTYERGVEAETYSCGTGVTAAALAANHAEEPGEKEVKVHTRGGDLRVRFTRDSNGHYSDIWLTGPAVSVFDGKILLP